MVVGSVFNGVTACITMAAPPLLSALWFPTSERTTATAIGANGGYIGTGLAFITSKLFPFFLDHGSDPELTEADGNSDSFLLYLM